MRCKKRTAGYDCGDGSTEYASIKNVGWRSSRVVCGWELDVEPLAAWREKHGVSGGMTRVRTSNNPRHDASQPCPGVSVKPPHHASCYVRRRDNAGGKVIKDRDRETTRWLLLHV